MQRHAFLAPVEQVRRQAHGQIDGAWVVTGNAQALGISEFTELHRTIAGQPVRRVIWLARLQAVDAVDTRACAGQHLAAADQRQRRLLELLAITPGQHQQLAVGIIGVGQQAQAGRTFLRQFDAGNAGSTDHQNNRMALGRQLSEADREARTTVAGQGAEPGRHRTGRFQGAIIRAGGKHERQLQRTRITPIEERQRQLGQIVRHDNLRGFQLQLAAVADLGPQAGMQRILTHHGVVADQLQRQAVELGHQVYRDIHGLLQQRAGSFLGHGQADRQLIVDHHVDLRQIAEQRGRIAVLEIDTGLGYHLIGTHIKTDAVTAFDATQVHRVIGAQLLERGAVGRHELGHQHFCGGLTGLATLLDHRYFSLGQFLGPGCGQAGRQQRNRQSEPEG